MLLYLALSLLVILSAIPALALWRGRDSRVWHAVARLMEVAPTVETSMGPPATLPLRHDLAAGAPHGWAWFQRDHVTVLESERGLAFRSERETVWYENERGPMLWLPVSGAVDVRATVRTRKASDPDAYPDEAWQFGGIILRDPSGEKPFSRENYVFTVVGHRGDRLQVENKSTRQGRSDVLAFDWETGDAELRIERRGTTFRTSARPIGASDWQELSTFDRPDLPSTLQLGLISYSFDYGGGRFDLIAEFESIEVLTPN